MFRTFAACLMLSVLSGCVGVLAYTRTEKGFEHSASFGISDRVGEYGRAPYRKERDISKSDVLTSWGTPKRKFNKDGLEYWTYDYDVAWRGLVFWLVFPVPLLVPVGYNETIVEFNGDNVTRWWNEEGGGGGFACAPNAGSNAESGPLFHCEP